MTLRPDDLTLLALDHAAHQCGVYEAAVLLLADLIRLGERVPLDLSDLSSAELCAIPREELQPYLGRMLRRIENSEPPGQD
jgi:hypothetical protein